jgi:transposase
VKRDKEITQAAMPWEGLSNGFTMLFEELLLHLCMSMPILKVSKLTGESDDKIWRFLKEYVVKALRMTNYSDVRKVGIDETSRAKGHDYITLFVDLVERNTLFIADGKGSETVTDFISILERQNGKPENITEVSCDMSPAFVKGVGEKLPEAKITFDRFHVMKVLTNAVDDVRRAERKTDPALKKLRFLFLKNGNKLNEKERIQLESLKLSECGKKTLKAYHLKELFRLVYEAKEEAVFESYLRKWYGRAIRSRLTPMVKAAKTIKDHWDGIVRWRTSQVSNGILEGLNSLIQAAKARARGYSSPENFKIIAFLLTAKLDFGKLNPFYLPT